MSTPDDQRGIMILLWRTTLRVSLHTTTLVGEGEISSTDEPGRGSPSAKIFRRESCPRLMMTHGTSCAGAAQR
jgi:hypothetical protein